MWKMDEQHQVGTTEAEKCTVYGLKIRAAFTNAATETHLAQGGQGPLCGHGGQKNYQGERGTAGWCLDQNEEII